MNMHRNQIIINIGHKDYWLSMVSIDYDGVCPTEIALVRRNKYDFFGISLVPVSYWLSEHLPDNGGIVDFTCRDERQWAGMTDGEVLCTIITKATEYVDSITRGIEIVREPQ